jgi:hypothetical protein
MRAEGRVPRHPLNAWFRTGLSLLAVGLLVTWTSIWWWPVTTGELVLAWLGIAIAATGAAAVTTVLMVSLPRRHADPGFPDTSLMLLLARLVVLCGAFLLMTLLFAASS